MAVFVDTTPKVGDVGTAIEITVTELDDDGEAVVINISTATSKFINFQRPDGTTEQKTAAFTTDGTDGKIRYVTVSGFLDQAGGWKIEGEIHIGGSQWSTDIFKMKVGRVIEV
jgi:hypothetical protein